MNSAIKKIISRLDVHLQNILDDSHVQEVYRGTLLAFVLKVFSAGLAFSFNVAVARLLGADGAGVYFLALAVTTIASVIGRVGLDNTLLRFVAVHASHEEWDKVKGVYVIGMRMVVIAASLISIIVFLASPWMAISLFHKPELSDPLRWMSLSILPFALLNLHAESLKGLKQIRDAMLVQGIGLPLFGLLLIVPMAQTAGVLGVCFSYLAAVFLMAILAVLVWQKHVTVYIVEPSSYSLKEMWSSCYPLFKVSFVGVLLTWAPLFMLGIWVSSDQVGIFGAALRISILVSFVLLTVNNVSAPKFAELYSARKLQELEKTARHTAMLTTIFASPLLLIFIFGGHQVMALFGESFVHGYLVLVILSVGQFVNAVTGSSGFILTMSGHENEAWKAVLYSVCLLLSFSILLIPTYGINGAAFAVMVSEITKNSLLVYYCNNKVEINPLPFKLIRLGSN